MTAIARQSAKIFAQNAPVGQVTAFRTTESTPQTTKAPDQIQNENYLQGWLNADGSGNVLPYAEDMNGLFYTLSYNTAYLYEKGIPEYSSTQTYYLNSFCQYSGTIYRCKGDSVINIAPTNTNYWDALPSTSYTATTIGAGTTNYGTVYAGTNTAGTQFQFKTIIGGSNVTISETADSLTISSTGGGGGTAITANAPLDLTNNVLSIPAATSSQGGYLTAADWTSFNSKLSSTIFSANNTWTGTNTVRNLIPSTDSTYDLGSSTYAWQALHANYIFSNSSDHLVIGNTDDLNRILINYTTAGANWGIFPDTISGTDSYLGDSVYQWDYAYIDTATISTNKIKSDLTVGQAAAATASRKITLSGYTGSTESTLTQWATFGYFGTNSFAFNPYTTDTGYIGSRDYIWNQCYFSNTHTANIYATYDAVNTVSKIGLYYNSNATETSPTQWGWLGYLSNTEIGIFPSTNNTGNLGSVSLRWNTLFATTVNVGAGGGAKVSNYRENNDIFIGWKDPVASKDRGVNGYHAYFFPEDDNEITLGSSDRRWKEVWASTYTLSTNNNLALTSIIANSSANIALNWQYASYKRSVNGYHESFIPGANDLLTLGADGYRWKQLFAISSTINTSDRRLKSNIEELSGALDKLNEIGVYSYTMKGYDKHINYGFIAQDELERNPELVYVPDNYSEKEGGGYLGVVDSNVLFLAVKAIQELSAEVDDLKKQLQE